MIEGNTILNRYKETPRIPRTDDLLEAELEHGRRIAEKMRRR